MKRRVTEITDDIQEEQSGWKFYFSARVRFSVYLYIFACLGGYFLSNACDTKFVYLMMLGDKVAPVPVIHLIPSRNARVGPKTGLKYRRLK